MKKKNYISDWLENCLAEGKFTFTIETIRKELDGKSEIAIKRSLSRLSKQNKIISIHKSFYIIIPPSYKNMGALPPVMFIDDLMAYLDRPYYVSLLSAAALLGAAHQQPQKSYVCTIMPSLRSTDKDNIRIKYITKRSFPNSHIIQKKTESGYVNLSDKLLTCIDLVNYQKSIGGLNRAVTIINELSEEIEPNKIDDTIFEIASQADLQRIGYLWENEVNQPKLSDQLFILLKDRSVTLKPTKLISNKSKSKTEINNRWKININAKIEIDE